MRDEGKWIKLPSVSDARKHDRRIALAMIDAITAAKNPVPVLPPAPVVDPNAPKTFGDALERWKRRRFEQQRSVGERSQGTYKSWLKNFEAVRTVGN